MSTDPITKEVYKRAFPALVNFKSTLLLDHTLEEMIPQIEYLRKTGELKSYLESNNLLSELREIQLTNNSQLKKDVLFSCLEIATTEEAYIDEYINKLLLMLTSE